MFIYKVTNKENNLCYIGLDTHAEHRQKRWNEHQRKCEISDTKFYLSLRNNINNFSYEIIDRADKILDLALREIYWIDYYDSYKNGYNSTRGGDGLNQDLSLFSDEEVAELKKFYSMWMTEYNHTIKWRGTTEKDRKELTSHLHTAEIYKKKSETLKLFYAANPSSKEEKGKIMENYWKALLPAERAERCNINRENSLKGAGKVSKKVKIQLQDGTYKIYNSKSEFNRAHGEIINAILRKTKENKSHRGFMGWEI